MEQKTTVAWITQLLAEAEKFDPAMFPPVGELKSGEQVLGDCPEEAKSFFALARYYGRECQRMKLEASFQPGGLSADEKMRWQEMDQKEDTLMEIFWGTVHHCLNTWGKTIGAREGWKIVESKHDEPQEILRGFLGINRP